ncbi:hypothetical protein M501DRAFT_929185 [Patellaria atrata CBS 101060]|uniref:Wax synthase domain-containing protein n=1 Tax=Patellaria atrata CBS 101060 TaxID=1346257 RepID=A0A9P4SER9_9PEZI|nr:hypothetical protein M501DRAFT_929185 [Patellaria atrata CBS 101060]
MSLPIPRAPQEARQQLHTIYDAGIASGAIEPFVYPSGAFASLVVITYLLIDHRNRPLLRFARFVVWAYNAYFAAYCILYTRARNMSTSYCVGLVSMWSIFWCYTILIANDAQADFQRMERTEGVYRGQSAKRAKGQDHSNGSLESPSESKDSASRTDKLGDTASPRERTGGYAWQPYPLSPFIERLDWVADIFSNFRGIAWNWKSIPNLPAPPPSIQSQLHSTSGTSIPLKSPQPSRDNLRRHQTKRELLSSNLQRSLGCYLLVDVLKTYCMHDRYFWGIAAIDSPIPYLPSFLNNLPALPRALRLAVTLYAMKTMLLLIFSMAPLFFVGALGPKAIGARGEPWMYPDSWGSYSHVLDNGLAGWWGAWWHQIFRFAFEAPSKQILRRLSIPSKSIPGRIIQLFVAFFLSGCLHASGSYTQLGPTNPLSGPMRFFLLQPLGILLQVFISSLFRKSGAAGRLSPRVKQLTNFVYVHCWFYYTAPLLCDDFVRGGLWLFEPIPISPLRGLGFGAEGENGWWWWGGDWVRWHEGKHWWESGIAL